MTNIKQTIKLSAISLALLSSINAAADQVILDDLIVVGSVCVGLDCVNGESFGFDTLRLKENNVRIGVDDTSISGSFPSNDWQLTFNDSSNGGANKFSIDDIGGGRTPFTIEAGAPSNALYVDDSGSIGVGTATPVVEMHIVNGDSPTLRLEQDGSSGFTPQTWDLAGNETNFFVRDVTNGSKLPFKIKPGAPTNSLYVDTDGDIGLGTQTPDADLHVVGSGLLIETSDSGTGMGTYFGVPSALDVNVGTHGVLAVDTSDVNTTASIAFAAAGTGKWLLSSRNSFDGSADDIGFFGSAGTEIFGIRQDGSLTSSSGASLTSGGTWTNASSRELKESIVSIASSAAIEALANLNPVTFEYISEPGETYAGFIAEDVPEIVATNDRKGLSPMDIVAVLTKVVQEQQATISNLNKRLDTLESSK